MLLAVAIYLLSFIPQVPVLFLWAALFIITAVYLGATQSLPKEASGWQYLWKGIGTVLLIWGVLALLGGMAGSRDILSPMPFSTTMVGTATAQPAPATEVHFLRVRNLTELDTKLAEAKAAGKPVLLDYYATWCTDCVRMEKATFTNPRVAAEMRRFVLLQTDVTDPSDVEAKAIKQRYGVFGPPAMLFFSPAGSEQRELRTYGFKTPEDFIALLKRVG
jgi:thiol:disulfide interchange protein DsbD